MIIFKQNNKLSPLEKKWKYVIKGRNDTHVHIQMSINNRVFLTFSSL